ncbi:hypothetical protein HM131_08540 [Halobacillus mangrovi]|uniref:TRAP C4-dicarboxylate transport system permease DctM subunit domain-containing protein n=2 Tax=Halobacillus mangrovi TaxID=402384 RepID=A0A1W6A0K5_9BACI|nr:hypothetical protein HM131_08540 [Halobacillus mangrovi]
MSIFHLYTAVFGVFESFLQRSAHLGFAMILSFAIYKPSKRLNQTKIPWYDVLAILMTVGIFIYFAINAENIASRMSYVEELSQLQIVIGMIAGLLLLEVTRRVVGTALMLIVVTCLAYALWGQYIPGFLSHKDFTFMWIIDHLFYTTGGVFSIPLGVSATFIFIFVFFGKFLEITGAGKFFIDLSVAAMGKYRGGPAKTAIFASSTMGTISGSAVANTVTTGAFTIPMMKKTGYNKEFAGAVESVSSSGGQIMPPIMGASAFIIASYVGVPYTAVALAGIIPALLYYLCLFFQVDLRAKRKGLRGLRKDELPNLKRVLIEGYLFFIPLLVIVFFLMNGNSPMRAGLYAIVSVILVASLKSSTRLSLKKIIDGLDLGARAVLETAIACGAAGMVIGVLSLTGLGLKFSGLILTLAGGSLFLTLIFTMISSIILGMGLPTVAAYIVQVALTVPALIELGVAPLAAHMFVFYFAIISAITPPVSLAAFAAAGIAGSDPMRTGITALRLGIAAFIVPFIFVYGPSILLIGDALTIIITLVTAILGIIAMAAAAEGWVFRHAVWYERLMLFLGAVSLVYTGVISDLLGLGFLLIVFVLQKYTLNGNFKEIKKAQ